LEKLNAIHEARYGHDEFVKECLDGTREKVLQAAMDWATTSGSPPIFWLSGRTGTGKTAIAESFCKLLKKNGMLGGSFFANRDTPRRKSGNIVRTMAYDLARNRPDVGFLISEALQHIPDVSRRTVDELVAALLVDPLTYSLDESSRTVVLVLDGLNSCRRDREGRPAGPLVSTLISALRRMRVPVKLFVSSSSENGVQDLFDGCKVDQHHLEPYPVRADVQRFYNQAFEEIRRDRAPTDWPSASDVEILVTMAGPLFIFASTVVEYISQKRHNPVERLRSVLDSGSSQAFAALDSLYLLILRDAVLDDRGREDDRLCDRVHRILTAVVFAAEPMRMAHLAGILDIDLTEMAGDLKALSSLIVVPADIDSTQPIRVFHSSFSDFLCDINRCSDERFYLDMRVEHANLGRRCLELVAGLTPDICQLEQPGLLNSEVHNLDQRLSVHLPGHLEYACRNWVVHAVEAIRSPDSGVSIAVQDFLDDHAAPWIEACSLLHCISTVMSGLRTLAVCLQVRHFSHMLASYLSFCRRLCLKRGLISRSSNLQTS
jgi:hypothetical protein